MKRLHYNCKSLHVPRSLLFCALYVTLAVVAYGVCTICLTITPNIAWVCPNPLAGHTECSWTNADTVTYYKLGGSSSSQEGFVNTNDAVIVSGHHGVGACTIPLGGGNYLGNAQVCNSTYEDWSDSGYAACLMTNYCRTP